MKKIAYRAVLVSFLFAALLYGNAAIHAQPIELIQPGGVNAAFSPDGKLIAINYGHTNIWERSTGRKLRTLQQDIPLFSTNMVAFSPDGKKIAITGRGSDTASNRFMYHIIILDVATWKKEQTLKTREGFNKFLSFSPNGKLLLTDTDSKLTIWSIEQGIMLKKFDEFLYSYESFRFSADGKTLFNQNTGQRIDIVTGNIIPAPERSGDENLLYHTETTSGERLSLVEFRGSNNRSYSATFIKDEQTLGTTIPLEIDGEVRKDKFSISSNGNFLSTNRYDEGIEIWDLRTGKRIGKIPFDRAVLERTNNEMVGKVIFSPDGESIMICVDHDNYNNIAKIQIWDIKSIAALSQKQADQQAEEQRNRERMLRDLLQ